MLEAMMLVWSIYTMHGAYHHDRGPPYHEGQLGTIALHEPSRLMVGHYINSAYQPTQFVGYQPWRREHGQWRVSLTLIAANGYSVGRPTMGATLGLSYGRLGVEYIPGVVVTTTFRVATW
jgi:hypothetical protein